jgi:DNA methylase
MSRRNVSASSRKIIANGMFWDEERHQLDCHVAPVPQTGYLGHHLKQHPCQKPVSVMKWLINALSDPGDLVVSPFCGVAPCGIAAIQLGRQYHGIEVNNAYRKVAEDRLRAFGKVCPATGAPTKPIRINTVVEGNCLDLIPALPDRSINLVVTSPPYAQQRHNHYASVSEDEYPEFTVRWMSALWPKLRDDGSVLIVIDPHVKKGLKADYVLRTQLALRDFAGNSTARTSGSSRTRTPPDTRGGHATPTRRFSGSVRPPSRSAIRRRADSPRNVWV